MKCLLIILGFVYSSESFIIPDEVPSLLSVIYSNIPTLKKGTDSRLGWGFRLGDRADFQVITELGPQTYTQPLANQGDDENKNKRNTLNSLANQLYAQRQRDKLKLRENVQSTTDTNVIEESNGGKWLESWRKTMQNSEKEVLDLNKAKPGLAIGEIDAKSVITEENRMSTTEKPLDDVDLE